jgi:hypothetical protein
MKKTLLLGTTALMAAGLVASGTAQAAEEPIVAGIGGYIVSGIGIVSQDNEDGQLADAQNSAVIGNDVQISVSGSTTLDNGITAGFVANIEGSGASQGALDDRFGYLKGSFGMIRFGQTESARQKMTTTAPNAAGIFGINSPFFTIGTKGGLTFINTNSDGLSDDDSIKVLYFSPSFNGFKVGVSYASTGGNNDFYEANTGDVVGGLQNEAAIGLEYNGNFGDTALRLSGGYESYVLERCNASAAVQTCNDNPDAMNFGAKVSFGDFSVGGSFIAIDQVALATDGSSLGRDDFDFGVSWGSGPLSMSLLYGEAEQEVADATTDTLSLVELNMQYAIGPGIDLAAAVVRGEFDDGTEDVVGALDNSYTEIKAGVAMWF